MTKRKTVLGAFLMTLLLAGPTGAATPRESDSPWGWLQNALDSLWESEEKDGGPYIDPDGYAPPLPGEGGPYPLPALPPSADDHGRPGDPND